MTDIFTSDYLAPYWHVDGFEFFAPKSDFSAIHLGHENDYEGHLRVPLLQDARKAINAIDVGANIGLLALPLSRAISGHLYCFEMSERNARILLLNAGHNKCRNITVFPMAIGEGLDSSLVRLSSHTTLNTMLHRVSAEQALDHDVRLIPTVTLDALFAGGPRIDLIKIDVDGWDLQALRGGLKTISRDRPVIYTEYCPAGIGQATGESEKEFLSLLLTRGHRPQVLGPNMAFSVPTGQSADELHAELARLLTKVEHLTQTHLDLRWSIAGLHGDAVPG